ncbi:MAG TPA: asparagine synthase (glutamine-hydrolyzing) [Phycisphaerae bacterium]|nr:asparagine synthase (glutamine-hydrolyzing) [Phycisphaerae bacterium]HRR84702.1 asparagine synthase (glutamine-hydrolyzing) [Phycisphaerae bacterium]
MCGIAGIIDFAGRLMDPDLLRNLCGCLAHRGPDDTGIWAAQTPGFSVGLAHTRLAVIDPTPDGHQPMTDPSHRRAIVYNGELYNYRELREQLPGPFETACDTEVALAACMHWGPEALRRFDAMWAMAYVDLERRSGHLSRDPMGIKPLYWTFHNHRLVFASELSTLCRIPEVRREIDPQAVALYLTLGWIPHPRTIFAGVQKLSPGHCLFFDARGPMNPEPFFRLNPLPAPPPAYADAVCELRRRVEEAVLAQRIADVPLGAFLSGGLDSSIVTACLARAGPTPVETFSIGYADHPRYDETEYAELVARHLGTRHHTFRLAFKDVLDAVEPVLNHLGEPFADSSLLPAALVSRYTRRHVTVALSGDGGDELFAGYWRYAGHHYLARYRRLPRVLRRGVIEPMLKLAPQARSNRLLDRLRQARKLLRGDLADPLGTHLAWARIIDQRQATELLGPERAAGAGEYLVNLYRDAPARLRADAAELTPLDRILLADLAIGLPADMLHKVDTASMLHSLEVRVPLLSVDVVNFAASLPIEYKLQGSIGKRILRDAFRDVLPEPILNRKKMGFEVPVGEFLRNELAPMYKDLVTKKALQDFGVRHEAAQRLYEAHCRRRADHTEILWALLVLCHWKSRKNQDGR